MIHTELETESAVETRSGDGYEVAEVNFPKRVVTVVAMPYERPTEVIYGRRIITEVVSRTAFNGIEKRTSQIRANRDHTWDKIVGKIVGLHPSRKEGLVAEVKIFQTPLGDETLTLCDEGGLDASAGFCLLRRDDGRVYPDAEVWERNRSVRRLNRIRLDHLALVPNPAYADAVTLDVRQSLDTPGSHPDGSTPNRDQLATLALLAQHEDMNRRWL